MSEEHDILRGSTRRQFLQQSGAIAFALGGSALPALVVSEGRVDVCADLWQACIRNNCEPEEAAGRWIRAKLCRAACYMEYVQCRAQQMQDRMRDVLRQAQDWLQRHPETVVGTVIVIGGVALIVFAGPGGALALAFA